MQTRDILERARQAQYLTRLQGFNNDISLEFLQNLQNESMIVKGRTITVTEAILVEVTGLPIEGIIWVEKHMVFHEVVELFRYPCEELA